MRAHSELALPFFFGFASPADPLEFDPGLAFELPLEAAPGAEPDALPLPDPAGDESPPESFLALSL